MIDRERTSTSRQTEAGQREESANVAENTREQRLAALKERFLEQPILMAEVGTGGMRAGFDVAHIPEGSTVFTVDLPVGVGASAHHHDVHIDKVSALYSNEIDYRKRNGSDVANFQHQPVFADAQKAPFRDNTLDVVLLCDVISDPGISSKNAAALISEALRIVKPDGYVVLSNALTRNISDERLNMSNIGDVANVTEPGTVEWRVMRYLTNANRSALAEYTTCMQKRSDTDTSLVMFDDAELWKAHNSDSQNSAISEVVDNQPSRKRGFGRGIINRLRRWGE